MALKDAALAARLEALLDSIGRCDRLRAGRLLEALARRPQAAARRARAAAKRAVEDAQLHEEVAQAESLIDVAVEGLDLTLTPRELAALRLAALDAALEEVAGAPGPASLLGGPVRTACG